MSFEGGSKLFRNAVVTAGKGVGTLLPLLVTLYVVFLLGSLLESYFGGVLRSVMADDAYIPGLGFLFGLFFLIFLGFLIQITLLQSFLQFFEGLITRVPLLKSVYGSIRDFTEYFQSRSKSKSSSVVLFQPVESEPARLVGFRMSENVDSHIHSGDEGEWCSVYLPMSYQVGGFTVIVPASRLIELDWSFEEAMRYVITAGVKSPKREKPQDVTPVAKAEEPEAIH
ncbi:DUF502 domain-containing protein [Puniceicoccus vermicola]|uniref:DUF502 domain-containing protein n=1 Tax=Puniceicoccus vermicola TaxID=388746 RepID=A0A7X1B1M2_9BACT|nr:DUF502 domain-containing protein [Puniceicoccus vermicola]MBC2603872.1 DUF502 domain-containing protein [Puniceicoccus vermicola]